MENRDNVGADVGLIDYDLRWHLGDRFSILSDGAAETFGDGLRTVSIGMLLNRPERGNAYLGFRTMGGPFEAHVLSATLNYRMSPSGSAPPARPSTSATAATSASPSPSAALANRSSPRSAATSTNRKTTSA